VEIGKIFTNTKAGKLYFNLPQFMWDELYAAWQQRKAHYERFINCGIWLKLRQRRRRKLRYFYLHKRLWNQSLALDRRAAELRDFRRILGQSKEKKQYGI
jgi:hypothetical protein